MRKSNLLLNFLIIAILGCTTEQKETTTESSTQVETSTKSFEPFTYLPKDPVNPVRSGVVILGSSGFDSFIIDSDSSGNWKLVKASYGESQVLENQASFEVVKNGLENYIKTFIDEGVNTSDVHFLVSSSAKENDKVKEINRALKDLKYQVNLIEDEQEGKYAYIATMPVLAEYYENGYVLDMGSGNTKVSWMEEGNIKTKVTYGSKYYLQEIEEEQILENARAIFKQIPEDKREFCFIIGGVPYQLAKNQDQYTDRYLRLDLTRDFSTIDDQKVQTGLKLIQVLREEAKTSKIIFDWNSNFSVGFLLDRYASGDLFMSSQVDSE